MLLAKIAVLYDRVRFFWDNPRVSRRLSVALVALFLAGLAAIYLKKNGLLPAPFAALTPESPFAAIHLAFTLVLAMEVVALIFAVADSVSLAVRKQLEIMALLLLRDAFKDIGLLHTPVTLGNDDTMMLLQIMAAVAGALILFICLGIYMRMQKSPGYIRKQRDLLLYVNAKKCISLCLLVGLAAVGVYDVYFTVFEGKSSVFFLYFYSSLIFTDILIVLICQCFMPSFHATFRNSGYAVGTLLMRLALGAPHILGAGLCVFAGFYILVLTWATARFLPPGTPFPEDGPPLVSGAALQVLCPQKTGPGDKENPVRG